MNQSNAARSEPQAASVCFGPDSLAEHEPVDGDQRRAHCHPRAFGFAGLQAHAERPVGWRGDWTGRFPGATPPMEWSRRVKGITSEIKYQAGKPSGEPGKSSFPLEYFTLKEWLVAGPFAAEDPAKDIEKDFLGGEDQDPAGHGRQGGRCHLETSAGRDRHAEPPLSQRRHLRGSERGFRVRLRQPARNRSRQGVGSAPQQQGGLRAHLDSFPVSASVMLRVNYAAAALKVFLNGRVVAIKRGQPVEVTLEKGWNRLC